MDVNEYVIKHGKLKDIIYPVVFNNVKNNIYLSKIQYNLKLMLFKMSFYLFYITNYFKRFGVLLNMSMLNNIPQYLLAIFPKFHIIYPAEIIIMV